MCKDVALEPDRVELAGVLWLGAVYVAGDIAAPVCGFPDEGHERKKKNAADAPECKGLDGKDRRGTG